MMGAVTRFSQPRRWCSCRRRPRTGPPDRPRARDLGIAPGAGQPGPLQRDHRRRRRPGRADDGRRGDNVRTGVTAILPARRQSLSRKSRRARCSSATPSASSPARRRCEELGTIESPIVLTNTLVGRDRASTRVVRWTLDQQGNDGVRSVNALVGETNDGGLNDIRGLHVTREHVTAAIAGRARPAPSRKAPSAPAPARSRSAGRAASARRRAACRSRRTVDHRRAGADQLRRAAHDRRRAGLAEAVAGDAATAIAGTAESSGRNRRRLLHDRRRHRRAARCARPRATRRPRDLRARPHGSTYSNGSGDFAIAFSTIRPTA